MCEKKVPAGGGNRSAGGAWSADAGVASSSYATTPREQCQEAVEIYDELGTFYPIDNRFIDDGYAAAIGCHGTAVYNVLKRHARAGVGDVWPSYSRIAQRAGVSYRMVMSAIAALEALGLIYVKREPGRSNVITLTAASKWRTDGTYIDAHGRETTIDVQATRESWTPRKRRGRPRAEQAPAEADDEKPPRNSRTFSEKPPRPARRFFKNPRALRVPTPAHGAYEQETVEQDTPRSEQEPSSLRATRQPEPPALQNDDDAPDLAAPIVTVEPEPERNTNGRRAHVSPVATVSATPGTRFSAPALAAAEWVLREVAPNFDDAGRFCRTHDPELVGWIATGLLLDADKRRRLSNPAGWLRRQVEQRATPNGSSRERWREIVAAVDAGEEPRLDDPDDRESYEALRRRYVPAGWEDLIEYE